jgi:hypothetical protein
MDGISMKKKDKKVLQVEVDGKQAQVLIGICKAESSSTAPRIET